MKKPANKFRHVLQRLETMKKTNLFLIGKYSDDDTEPERFRLPYLKEQVEEINSAIRILTKAGGTK